MAGGPCEENSHSAQWIWAHLSPLQHTNDAGVAPKLLGSGSKLSHGDVIWPEFGPLLHNTVLLLSISRLYQTSLLSLGTAVQHTLKPNGMQLKHLGSVSCLMACLSPLHSPGQQHTLHSPSLPCFLTLS